MTLTLSGILVGARKLFRMPPGMARHLAPKEPASISEAVEALSAAIERLKIEETRHPHPVFGRLTRHEWDLLHMRHAEMHLSFANSVDSEDGKSGLSENGS